MGLWVGVFGNVCMVRSGRGLRDVSCIVRCRDPLDSCAIAVVAGAERMMSLSPCPQRRAVFRRADRHGLSVEAGK